MAHQVCENPPSGSERGLDAAAAGEDPALVAELVPSPSANSRSARVTLMSMPEP